MEFPQGVKQASAYSDVILPDRTTSSVAAGAKMLESCRFENVAKSESRPARREGRLERGIYDGFGQSLEHSVFAI